MIIETKHNVGDIFWMPRVKNDYKIFKLTIGGMEYQRYNVELVAYSIDKKIIGIDIEVNLNGDAKIIYRCIDVDETNPMLANFSKGYPEADFKFTNKEDAFEFATKWKELNNSEYFGEPR
jgi:hypothetical protein